MKLKEIKFVELETQIQKQKEEIARKDREIEERDNLLRQKDDEISKLRKRLEQAEAENVPSLTMAETPKVFEDRGYGINNRFGREHLTVYQSLKQEIKELSCQVSYDSKNICKLK